MNRIIRCKNPNNRRIALLLVLQVFFAVAPMLLLIFFVEFGMYETKPLAIVVIVLMLMCNMAYLLCSRRYNILNSGRNGEKKLYKTIKKLNGDNIIFVNMPIRYKSGRSETDVLVINSSGVIIIEVKNHSGTIVGDRNSDKWTQNKYYGDGKTTAAEMDNPIKQMRRQRDIVKSIFNAAGENVWIDTVLYFSNPNVRLRLNLREGDYVCMGTEELTHFLRSYNHNKQKLTAAQMERYAKILDDARSLV